MQQEEDESADGNQIQALRAKLLHITERLDDVPSQIFENLRT